MNKVVFFLLLVCLVVGCKSPEARRPITVKSGSFIKESAERNKKLYEKEQQKIKDIINANPQTNYLASESGFWYFYNVKVEQDTITPKFGDIVNFNYSTKDFSGNSIYSLAENKTRNYAMDQEELFTGLREGLKLMKPGETITFLFPSQKAYGYYGDSNKIGTNTPLVCEVTVNTIIQNQN